MTRDLMDALRAERAALLKGDLEGLSAKRDDVIEALKAEDIASLPAGSLSALRSAAAENERLLVAAQQGLHAAIARLRECRSVQAALTTYGRDGRLHRYQVGESEVEHRA